MKRFAPGFLTLGLTLLLAGSVHADFLTGSFGIIGNFNPNNGTLVSTTQIDFIDCNLAASNGCTPPVATPTLTPGTPGQFLVTSATGNFGSGAGNLNLSGQYGSIKDFTFSGAGNAQFPNVPISFFEIVSALSFDLSTVTIVNQSLTCSAGAPCLQLSGTGTFNATGFDPTSGTWTFMGIRAQQVGGFIETFVFNSGNTATPPSVPEPSLLLLIGVGLVGLSVWGRVRARNTK
jgi:hypothetical protein